MKTLNTKYLPAQAGQIINTKNLLLATMFTLAFGERVFFDFGPNFELVTTVLVLSSFYFGRKQSFWLTFFIMLFSDLFIGNTNIFLFTWSGFLIPALFSRNLINKLTPIFSQVTNYKLPIANKLMKSFSLTSTGLASNLFFYLWTNFGVWLLSGMYSNTLPGLLMSYINALPFLKYQFISTLIFLPSIFFTTEAILITARKLRINISTAAPAPRNP